MAYVGELYLHSYVGSVYMIFFSNIYFIEVSWLTMFQVHSKVIQLYIYIYSFEIIFHYRLL